MKKLKETILVVMILIFGSSGKAHALSLSDGISNKQFNIITVTRNKTSQYDEPLLLNEIFVLFKNIDIMLGGICFDDGYSDIVFDFINSFYATNLTSVAAREKSNQHMSTYHSLLYSKLINEEIKRNNIFKLLKNSQNGPSALKFQKDIQNIFQSMNQRLKGKIKAKQISNCNFPTLLVFQEAIFSQTHLLSDEYVKFIIELCQKLTLSYNISISLNLLHQFDNNKCPEWITAAASEEKEVNSTGIDTGTTVANYSLIISNGQIANVYMKTEHDNTLQEGNDDILIKEKFRLKRGNFKSRDLLPEASLEKLVATRICADLNLLENPSSALNELNPPGILLIQSNTFSLASIDSLLNNLKSKDPSAFSSYLNRIIVHCDPGNGSSVFKITENSGNNDICAYLPISDWPKYNEELQVRMNSGIEVDVNNENCDAPSNSKLFFINFWPRSGKWEASYKFTRKDL